ncbi:hypothetical protein VKT23_012163 [Stygiomarasmius scandens]|uniref:Acyl-protein thioesterase 1 n=1 Tax=Marasmiellus scandens TaxID=2682957 RepID=A0ABR1JCL6_9AGAR
MSVNLQLQPVESSASLDLGESQVLKYLTITPPKPPTATIIFLHGLGDSALGWQPMPKIFYADPDLQHIKWIIPTAPSRSVTVNRGRIMNAWFDVFDVDRREVEDVDGMRKAVGWIKRLIDAEIESGTKPGRIIIAGISQGSVVSILTGLTSIGGESTHSRLAGVAVLASRIPMMSSFKELILPTAIENPIPMFWNHGTEDETITLEFAKRGVDLLREVGIPVQLSPGSQTDYRGLSFHTYEGLAHWISKEEVDDWKEWTKKAVPAE